MIRRPRGAYTVILALLLAFVPALSSDGPEDTSSPAPGEKPQEESAGGAAERTGARSDLAEALEGAGGLRVETMCTNCNIATVTMSGQTDDRVQVWKDGLPVMGGLGAIYLLSIMPSDGIESTEIVRGAGSVLSGSEAGAGALNIRTIAPGKPSIVSATVDVGGLGWQSQKVLAAGKLGRWGGEIAVTHARSDESDPNDDGNFDIGSFDRMTVGAAGTFEITDRSSLRFDALSYQEDQRDVKGAFERFEEGRGVFAKEDIDIRRDEFSLGWDHRFRGGSRLSVRTRYSKREQDSTDDSGVYLVQPYLLIDEHAKQASAQYERILFGRHMLTGGMIFREFEVEATIDVNDHIDDFIKHSGAYAQVDFSLPKGLGLTAGVRYDDYDWTTGDATNINPLFRFEGERARSRVSPRMRLAWKATQELALTLSAGYGFSAPRPVAERVCCGLTPTSNSISNAEVSRNVLLDADYVPYSWLKIRGSLFRSDFNDFLQKMAVFSAPSYHPLTVTFNYGDFALEGAEISTEMRFRNGLSYGLDWTHLHTSNDEPITVFLANSEFYDLPAGQIPLHPENQGSAFVRWEDEEHDLEVSAQGQYTGSMSVQIIPEIGFVTEFRDTRSFRVYNLRVEKGVYRGLSVFAGVDNITDEYQDWLDDPSNEYQWGPLRGRYYYGGISFQM